MTARLVAGLLLLAACRESKPVEPPTAAWLAGALPVTGGTFTARVHTEPAGLNVLHDQMAEATMARYTVGPVYETLAELDRESHPRYALKPLLAESWVDSPDHLTLTVRLKEGITFHNGEAFGSKDVKAVIDAIVDPKRLTTSMRASFADLAAVATPDARTVVLTWKKAYFLAATTVLTAVPMLPASALAGDFDTLPINRAPIGTGPFRFVSWETGKAITLARNDDYWGTKALLDRVVLRFVKDETIATQLWERGEFDLMTRIPPVVWRSIEAPTAANAWAIRGYHRIRFVENSYAWIGWNEERPFFSDPNVRRALAMLYPAEKMAKHQGMDLEPTTTCPFYPLSASCDPQVRPLPHDPAAAGALLKAAGWVDSDQDGVLDRGGVPFKFTFLANPRSVKVAKLVPLLQEQLRQAGIVMEIENVDAAQYVARLRAHDFDAASLAWSNSEPERDNYQVFHSSQSAGGSNYVSYRSESADALLEKIRTTFDEGERRALERQLHRLIYADQPYTFLTNRTALDAVKVRVRGLAPSLAWYDLRKVWLAE